MCKSIPMGSADALVTFDDLLCSLISSQHVCRQLGSWYQRRSREALVGSGGAVDGNQQSMVLGQKSVRLLTQASSLHKRDQQETEAAQLEMTRLHHRIGDICPRQVFQRKIDKDAELEAEV